jgi:hypothetical protein
MPAYTAHEPPLKSDDAPPDPERFVFVRDGFSLWAFLFGPLWMLRHRMWLVLLGYVTLIAILQGVLFLLGASGTVRAGVGLLLAILTGIEAGTLRRFTLARRGWTHAGVVIGDDVELAERRFFDTWIKSEPGAVAASQPIAPPLHTPPDSTDVIGLFPKPGAPR